MMTQHSLKRLLPCKAVSFYSYLSVLLVCSKLFFSRRLDFPVPVYIPFD